MYHRDLRQDIFVKDNHHYLNVPRVGTYAVYDTLDCTIECLSNPSCFSLNLAASKGADGKLWCELLSSEKNSNPGEYKRNQSSHHFFIKVTLLFPPPPPLPPHYWFKNDRPFHRFTTDVCMVGWGGTNLPQSITFRDFAGLKSLKSRKGTIAEA